MIVKSIIRESKISAADHILMKIRVLLDDEAITEFDVDTIKKAYQRYCETLLLS